MSAEPEPSPPFYRPDPTFHEKARRLEEKRRALVRQLWRTQSQVRDWIFVRDLAAWRARTGTENPPNEARRQDTYRLFMISFLRLAFSDGGRSWVHWWNPEFSFSRLTVEDVERFVANHCGEFAGLIDQYFQWCITPRRLARGWFQAEGWDLPPWLLELTPSNPSPPRRRPKPTRKAVVEWIRCRVANWPDHLPAPSEEADRTAARAHFGDGLKRDDFRAIRADETPPEWQKQGRRKPWGLVKNSANSA